MCSLWASLLQTMQPPLEWKHHHLQKALTSSPTESIPSLHLHTTSEAFLGVSTSASFDCVHPPRKRMPTVVNCGHMMSLGLNLTQTGNYKIKGLQCVWTALGVGKLFTCKHALARTHQPALHLKRLCWRCLLVHPTIDQALIAVSKSNRTHTQKKKRKKENSPIENQHLLVTVMTAGPEVIITHSRHPQNEQADKRRNKRNDLT